MAFEHRNFQNTGSCLRGGCPRVSKDPMINCYICNQLFSSCTSRITYSSQVFKKPTSLPFSRFSCDNRKKKDVIQVSWGVLTQIYKTMNTSPLTKIESGFYSHDSIRATNRKTNYIVGSLTLLFLSKKIFASSFVNFSKMWIQLLGFSCKSLLAF